MIHIFTNGITPSPFATYSIGTTSSQKATEWMAENPEAMAYMMDRAQEFKRVGQRFGVQTLQEHFRWFATTQTQSHDQFRMNNDFGAYIGRTLVLRDPSLLDLISFRRVPGECPTFGTVLIEAA